MHQIFVIFLLRICLETIWYIGLTDNTYMAPAVYSLLKTCYNQTKSKSIEITTPLYYYQSSIFQIPFKAWIYMKGCEKYIIDNAYSIQSKLPIRSPLFSVTLQSAVSSGSPRTISNANAPLFSTHLSNAANGQQKLSQIAKFSL